jgi:hypothetical protein
MRSLFIILAAIATGAAVAVGVAARPNVRRQVERHEGMPDVTAEPEPADA